jgi:hypothetical protein
MRIRYRPDGPVLMLVILLAGSGLVRAIDSVSTRDGATVRGELVSISPEGVEIEDRNGIRKVSIVDVEELVFDGEPDALRGARRLLLRRDARGAVEELAKIEPSELQTLEPRIREEYDFTMVAANAQAAETTAAASWEKQLADFLQKNSRSHHLYRGSEILGDLRARQGRFDEAVKAYAALDRGPPAIRIRGAAARAGLLVQQGRFADAIKEFTAAESIETAADDAASKRQKQEAAIGRARCLAETGKAVEGIAVAKQVVREASPKNKDLLAQAFTALGACQRAAGDKDQEAIISFLTVDLVYSLVPNAHAEALYNLIELWTAANQPERAREAAQTLTTSYPQTPWAAKASGSGKAS